MEPGRVGFSDVFHVTLLYLEADLPKVACLIMGARSSSACIHAHQQ